MPSATILLKIAAISEGVPLSQLNLRIFAAVMNWEQKPRSLSIGKRSRYSIIIVGFLRVRKAAA
jgi:hypothetical protein